MRVLKYLRGHIPAVSRARVIAPLRSRLLSMAAMRAVLRSSSVLSSPAVRPSAPALRQPSRRISPCEKIWLRSSRRAWLRIIARTCSRAICSKKSMIGSLRFSGRGRVKNGYFTNTVSFYH